MLWIAKTLAYNSQQTGGGMSYEVGERVEIPSPIDVHVHLREPGGEEKETIASGTYAALEGGYQAVFDMPNNPRGNETWTRPRMDQKFVIAKDTAQTNVGFYAGGDLENPDFKQLVIMRRVAAGFKGYLGHTYGNTKELDLIVARPTFDTWIEADAENPDKPPILLHAREGVGEEAADYIASRGYPVHWCHIASASEVDSVVRLTDKHEDLFTAGVTPHHLTMTDIDADFKWGWQGARMMPELGKEVDHDKLLWAFNNGYIQILETDHAPHTEEDKLKAETENPEGETDVDCTTCFGVSGIEFVLPIMMSLVLRKKIEMDRLVDATHTQPARMLGLKTSSTRPATTTIKMGPYTIGEDDRAGKSKNNPYVGWTAGGRVEQITLNGITRYHGQHMPTNFAPRVLRVGANI